MGKKMKLGSWQWPSCAHSKTLSFRANDNNNNIFKTINSIFLDSSTDHHHHHNGVLDIETTPESWFTNSSKSASFSTESDETSEPLMEMIIKGARSDRLFFEPNCTSSLILDEQKVSQDQNQETEKLEQEIQEDDDDGDQELPFKESVALALESDDPYLDFKKSMEEMVDTHEIKDWESLQELLGWYLKMNGKINHGFIIRAFVDLLIQFSPPNNCNSDSITCYSSAASSFSAPSSPLPSLENKE
ncbi:transcription repressor OFP13 [Lycium barbarum]|uniref:transcription repressor OFP13 n=1 Tax=Lycium barbarum TaxID=112863 RepID=UPI00293E3DAC|nr:transcription repressor OFP13 [Lycium barbarum]